LPAFEKRLRAVRFPPGFQKNEAFLRRFADGVAIGPIALQSEEKT